MKICSICKTSKKLTEFTKDKSTSDGLRCQCRGCLSEKRKYYYNNRPDKKCNKCFKFKKFSEFSKDQKSKDGYYGSCKKCNKIARENYKWKKTK